MAHKVKIETILIASDHAGLSLKTALQKQLPHLPWVDLGPTDANRVDYPDYAELLAQTLLQQQATVGILICGSGIGMSIAANKVPGIRAALVENPMSARLSREHNDANILCLGSRFLAPEYAQEIVEIWLQASFSQEGHHRDRLRKIHTLETTQKTMLIKKELAP